ncbi:hypothetical protein FB382_000775 [Nocardioides ginsengisegetis]|uniref:Uncharacterized protein n=1 Tax=Nocardioides ginsengisegetis TaxID=661491 RepID=A0A7W3P8J2_9ACTN|nr:hypothetical protein [Nocardioides ginsengisegetis]MBA8802484.1 hypothetical protein [Nocardioides ginsengisegetis]
MWRWTAAGTAVLTGILTLLTLGLVRSVVVVAITAGFGAMYGLALGQLLGGLRRPVSTTAGVFAGATVVLVGCAAAGRGTGVAALAALALTSPPLVSRLATRVAAPDAGPLPSPVPSATGLAGVDLLLSAWDLSELKKAWVESGTVLRSATTVEARARIVGVRQAYLDELERRTPETFGGWLSTQSLDSSA